MTKRKTEIKPLKDNVLIEAIKKEDALESGIIIPGQSEETPDTGIVIATSEEVTKLKEGDIVIFKKWGGIEIIDGGKEYLIVSEEDILAITGK